MKKQSRTFATWSNFATKYDQRKCKNNELAERLPAIARFLYPLPYYMVYEKRHKRIEERKAALLAKERQTKPEEAAEAENTQPTAEVQPEEHTQPEEVAAWP